MKRIMSRIVLSTSLLVLLAAGCESDDQRLAELAEEASQRQAEQNRQIARQNHELAEATNHLIEADAESRKELVALERDLQAERSTIGRERDELEDERREIANDRHWDSVAGDAIGGGATLIACVLPLVLCWYAFRALWPSDTEEGISDILTEELAGHSSVLLPETDATKGRGQLPTPE